MHLAIHKEPTHCQGHHCGPGEAASSRWLRARSWCMEKTSRRKQNDVFKINTWENDSNNNLCAEPWALVKQESPLHPHSLNLFRQKEKVPKTVLQHQDLLYVEENNHLMQTIMYVDGTKMQCLLCEKAFSEFSNVTANDTGRRLISFWCKNYIYY